MLLVDALARVRSGALRQVRPPSRALRPVTLLAATLLTGAALLLSAAADAAPHGGTGYGRPGGGAPPGGAYGRPPGGPPPGAWGRPGGPPPGAWGRPPGGPPPGAWGRPWVPAPRVGVYVGPGWGWGGWGWGGWGWGGSAWVGPGWGWGGWGWGWPGWSVPPVVVAPSPVVVPSNPPIFVERGDVAPSAQSGTLAPGYWYYCHGPAGYYPNVADCPGGWEQVAPLPQNPQ